MTRPLWLAAAALLGACALPPRVEDATAPDRAFLTFRGALAREEFDRAYGLLSDRLRRKIGVRSRADFADWGAVGGKKAVSAIRRAKAKGAPEPLPDGRALLRVRVRWLLFSREIRLWLTPIPVARVYVEGSEAPAFYDQMDGFALDEEGGVVGVRLTPEMRERLKQAVQGGRVRRFEAGIEWFLDDYELGDEERRE